MGVKKIYIAGKIGGLPDAEYKSNFEQAKIECERMGFTPVSPVDLPHEHDQSWSSYMKEDIRELTKCDAVYALRNWIDSPGARIEIRIANDLKIEVIQQP